MQTRHGVSGLVLVLSVLVVPTVEACPRESVAVREGDDCKIVDHHSSATPSPAR